MTRLTVRGRSAFIALGFGLVLAAASVGGAAATSGPAAHGVTAAGANRPSVFMPVRGAAHGAGPTRSKQLYFHGGNPGVVIGADTVYLVYWGSQWNNNDPSGEASIQQRFFNGVGGSDWNNSVTQYCQGVPVKTITCGTSGVHATNPTGVYAASWFDNSPAAPIHPTQTQLATEAARAAAHFGKTTSSSNTTVQYVINTATNNNATGFGTQYCAWHSWTSSSYGTLAYTNMPYITDAGAACGAGFNGLASTAGITIVGGHEFAETETDIFPNGGWLDRGGAENGDKCAWISGGQGAAANISLSTGTFAVQSLWSNAFNNNSGGCVLQYP